MIGRRPGNLTFWALCATRIDKISATPPEVELHLELPFTLPLSAVRCSRLYPARRPSRLRSSLLLSCSSFLSLRFPYRSFLSTLLPEYQGRPSARRYRLYNWTHGSRDTVPLLHPSLRISTLRPVSFSTTLSHQRYIVVSPLIVRQAWINLGP